MGVSYMGRGVSTPRDAFYTVYRELKLEDMQEDYDWKEYLEHIQEEAIRKWPSLYRVDTWAGHEDHVILQNDLVQMGVSEYGGVAAIWVKPREFEESAHANPDLAANWASQIEKGFTETFGQFYKEGSMSNGESVYRRLEPRKAKAKSPKGCGWHRHRM